MAVRSFKKFNTTRYIQCRGKRGEARRSDEDPAGGVDAHALSATGGEGQGVRRDPEEARVGVGCVGKGGSGGGTVGVEGKARGVDLKEIAVAHG